MKGSEKERRALELEDQLMVFHRTILALPGIAQTENLLAFVAQLIDSLHRIEYVQVIRRRQTTPLRADPRSQLFDPIRAAVLSSPKDLEEAFWLVFIATHCGRNLETEWRLAAEFYGAYEKASWTWARVSAAPGAYATWLETAYEDFSGKFGNHRKYETLKPGERGPAATMTSYVEWVRGYGSHAAMIADARARAKGDARKAFSLLYAGMDAIKRFGRTGRFDYLTMLAKLGLADIDADSTYMNAATGPKSGARLLFDGQIDSKTGATVLESRVAMLEKHLGVGMQVMEDALCNWQKSPNRYVAFRG